VRWERQLEWSGSEKRPAKYSRKKFFTAQKVMKQKNDLPIGMMIRWKEIRFYRGLERGCRLMDCISFGGCEMVMKVWM